MPDYKVLDLKTGCEEVRGLILDPDKANPRWIDFGA